jgi:SAM-dependent methyltransferase
MNSLIRNIVRRTLSRAGLLATVRAALGRHADGTPRRLMLTDINNEQQNKNQAKTTSDLESYKQKLIAEKHTFSSNVNVHDLPAIFHYWSNKYLLPKYEPFGFTCPNSFYCKYIEKQIALKHSRSIRIVSIGAGNCDTEIALALMLRERGYNNFVFDCFDINDQMLARGKTLAAEKDVSHHINPCNIDFNFWHPDKTYDVVLANQSLHHIEQLEKLFVNIQLAIRDSGVFITSDMIGRNGHMRWPEALTIVHEFWRDMPAKYKYNHQLSRHEDKYENWDCSTEGFEGVRAQDVLPLLVKNFHFDAFFTFGNLIDIFVDRGFGHNFDPLIAEDRDFIDRLHARDEAELLSGKIKPTHILAAMSNMPSDNMIYIAPFTPDFCLRSV